MSGRGIDDHVVALFLFGLIEDLRYPLYPHCDHGNCWERVILVFPQPDFAPVPQGLLVKVSIDKKSSPPNASGIGREVRRYRGLGRAAFTIVYGDDVHVLPSLLRLCAIDRKHDHLECSGEYRRMLIDIGR
jgi:hypothetical protein